MICDLAEKQREKEERRKDFGMMDGYVKENSNLHSSLGPRVSPSVSFFVFPMEKLEAKGEREKRDIEVAE